jgi:hypothetical protein
MSLLVWDFIFEELSQELGLDSIFFKERMEEALRRYLEEQVVRSFGLLSIEDGWMLAEEQLDDEPPLTIGLELDTNPTTLRYLYSKIHVSRIPEAIQTLQSRFPKEFITPSHIDQALL